jgi:dTDP-4-amino-4,6-dideoxygalactose transaminase
MQKIPLRANYNREFNFLKKKIVPILFDVIKNGRFILGSDLVAFEDNIAKYFGVNKAVGVASGTAALFLALRALGIKKGDEVITTSMSFHSTAETIIMCGAKPVFTDVLEQNISMDYKQIEKKISKKTKAIVVVHLYGIPAEMDKVMDIAKKYKLFVIEDCAQAHGAKYKGKYVGTFGNLGCFSFMPAKNLGCYGEGGCVITNSDEYAKKLKSLRNHGSSVAYIHTDEGFSERLDNLQAAVLNIKLPYLDRWNKRRNQIAGMYRRGLNKKSINTLYISKKNFCSYYAFVIKIKNREEVIKKLNQKKITTGIIYPLPLHLQPVLKKLHYKLGDLPIVEKISKEILAIPMNPFITDIEVKYIINEVNKAVAI